MAHTMFTLHLLALVILLWGSLCASTRMDHLNFNYSMKNVPLPSEDEYKIEFLNSIHNFDTRMRWRAYWYLNPQLPKPNKETFDLKTSIPPPHVPEMKVFQDGLCDIAQNLKFRKMNETFLNKLNNDLRNIKRETKIIVPADKTRNYYKMNKDDYKELLNNNITNV